MAIDLTFAQLAAANKSRVVRWHPLNSWTPLEWAGAMCGEAGEAANFAKKIKRLDDELQHHDSHLGGGTASRAEYAKQVGREVADVVIYGELLCQRLGVDLAASVREKFNEKSEEYGFPERL